MKFIVLKCFRLVSSMYVVLGKITTELSVLICTYVGLKNRKSQVSLDECV